MVGSGHIGRDLVDSAPAAMLVNAFPLICAFVREAQPPLRPPLPARLCRR